MVVTFNRAQNDAFFGDGLQMSLTNNQRQRLVAEGLAQVSDFEDFKEEQIDDAIKNLRTPIPGVPAVVNARGRETHAAIAPIPPCIISAKCVLRLKVASVAFHYFSEIGRDVTPENMHYTNVLRGFYQEWEALSKLVKEDRPDVPILTKSQTPIRWMESFKDCLSRTFGVRNCPIIYVIRSDPNVPDENEDQIDVANGRAYSIQAGSVIQEMIRRLSHDHPLYSSDNNLVYSLLDEATRGTIYAPTVKPYSKNKDGRSAWNAIISSHAGQDKWEALVKDRMRFIMQTKWNGKTYSLEKFTGLHRSAYVSLESAAEHVDFQLPSEHSRVGYILDNVTNSDPDLRAALASVRANVNNMRSDFEATVTFILPVCPYSKGRTSHRQPIAQVSEATLKGRDDGKSGVEFRWHTKEEYRRLSTEQKKELWQWQNTKAGKNEMKKSRASMLGKGGNKRGLKSRIASLEKKLESNSNEDKTSEEVPSIGQISAVIAATQVLTQNESKSSDQVKSEDSNNGKRKLDIEKFKAASLAVQNIMKRHKE